jgi:endonuclease-8
MPEGDTLFRVARTLATVLTGQTVHRLASPLPAIARASLVGRRIDHVVARGKNLLIEFDDGRTLHTHLRMHGAWHVYRAGERWRKPPYRAKVAIDVGAFLAVCFDAPVVRLLRPGEAASDPALAHLGPDLLADDFDPREALRRLKSLDATPIGVALLDQRALAGIGNIYKSETLFLCGEDPFANVATLSEERLLALIDKARTLMQDNTRPERGPRTTRDEPTRGVRHAGRDGVLRGLRTGDGFRASRYWVYKRSGRACYVCGARIAMKRQGTAARSTYYCPECQRGRSNAGETAAPR